MSQSESTRSNELLEAIIGNQPAVIEQLLADGVDPDGAESFWDILPPLIRAVDKGFVDVAAALIEGDADVNGVDGSGKSPLWKSMARRDTAMMRLLLKHGADADEVIDDAETLLTWAIAQHDTLLTNELILSGADVDKSDPQGSTPLTLASRENADWAARRLIGAGANIETLDDSERSPLSTAVKFGSKEVAAFLLTAGADPDGLESDEASPLMTAVIAGNLEILQILLAAGADPNLGDPFLVSSFAAMSRPELFRALAESGANLDEINADGVTCLNLAISYARTEVVAIMLENGANPNLANLSSSGGYLPLSTAMSGRFAHSIKEDLKSYQNKLTSYEITEMLLNAGADPNIRQMLEETPLSYAVANEDLDRVVQFMDAGGDPHVINYDGLTPLDIATRTGNTAIQARLVE